MIWATFFRGLWRLAGSVTAWAIAHPWQMLCVVLAVLDVWLWIGRDHARADAGRQKAQAAHWYSLFKAQKREMHTLTVRIRDARVDAARRDRENVARVKREWSHQLQEVSDDYRQNLAAARRTVALRLRGVAGPGATGVAGGGGQAGMPALPTLSTGAVRPGDAAIVDGADIDACTVNTLRLDQIIRAWNRASAIDVNGAVDPPLNGS